MAETDVLNPRSQWDESIQDNPCPDYGFSRSRPDLRARGKAPGGQPFSREVQNSGHTFKFSWLNRSYACVQRVMWFAANFEDDYFTILDMDGGGRAYTGRFTGDITPVETGNDQWDLRDVTFEEVPGAPMLHYPSDWDRDAIFLNAFTGLGKQNPATSGTWTKGTYTADDGTTLSTMENLGNAGEFLALDYRGYGYRLWLQTGQAYGQVQVFLDGVLQTLTHDDGSTTQTIDCYANQPSAPAIVLWNESLPIDLHRLKVVSLGSKNAGSQAAAVSFVRVQVMR